MVDALREIVRVVVAGGTLVDTRPIATANQKAPLEVVSPTGAWMAGEIDESPGSGHDAACEQALASAVDDGWIVQERRDRFVSDFYWPAEGEFEIGSHRHIQPSEDVRARARELLARHPGSRLRLRNPVSIARYRVAGSRPDNAANP